MKRILSLGSGTKPVSSSSMTQLSRTARNFFSTTFIVDRDDIAQEREKVELDGNYTAMTRFLDPCIMLNVPTRGRKTWTDSGNVRIRGLTLWTS